MEIGFQLFSVEKFQSHTLRKDSKITPLQMVRPHKSVAKRFRASTRDWRRDYIVEWIIKYEQFFVMPFTVASLADSL